MENILSQHPVSLTLRPIIEEDSLRLWNLESGEQTGSLDWHLSDIFQMDISPDGRRVLSGI